jgi:cation diffusion facilitator CzcD-associated flavoprotein CzcO
MLQRSPTYIAALPNKDKVAARIKRLFPKKIAYRLIRYKTFYIRLSFLISVSSILKK